MELLPRRGPKRTVSVMLKGSCSTGCLACSVVLMVSQVKRRQIQSNSQVQNDIAASHSLSPLYTNYLIDLFNPLLNTHGHLSVLTCHVGRGCYKPNQMICRCGCIKHLYRRQGTFCKRVQESPSFQSILFPASIPFLPRHGWTWLHLGCPKMVHVCVLEKFSIDTVYGPVMW